MRKVLLLMGLSMLGAMLFASVAFAQSPSASASGCTTSPAAGGESVTKCVDFAPVPGPDDAQYETASPSPDALPETGGSVSPIGAMLPLALLVGGGLLALRTVRRS